LADEKRERRRKMRIPKESFVVGALILALGVAAGCGRYRHPRWFHRKDLAKQEIRAKIEADLNRARDERNEFFLEIRTEMDRENPDLNRVVSLAKEQVDKIPVTMGEGLDHLLELYNILDEDQKAQLIELMRERIEKGGHS
jgi:Spy/CpxP family protein refolding chaperone